MTSGLRSLCLCSLAVGLMACTSSPGREPPADASDAANDTRDAAAGDAARDGAQMQIDARVPPGDAAAPGSDAQADAATIESDAGLDGAVPSVLASFVYVGGWADNYPVKTYGLNRETGAFSELNSSTSFGNRPSFITASVDGSRLYLTNESGGSPGITVASVDATTGIPSKLDTRLDNGGGFVHASIDPSGKVLLAADYNNGRLVSFPIAGDGKLAAAVTTISFGGSANTHSSGITPDGRFAFSPNKGLNKIGQFALNAATGQLNNQVMFDTQGNGPRMITIAKSGKFAYVVFENDASVEAYAIGNDGHLTQIDRESALPASNPPSNPWGGHALLHPNGKFLYVSERRTSRIVVFTVETDGKLTRLADVSSEGNVPRCFDIDSQGKWLIAANQGDNDNGNAGNLVAFEIGGDGKLTKRGTPITGLKAPTAVAIVTRAKP